MSRVVVCAVLSCLLAACGVQGSAITAALTQPAGEDPTAGQTLTFSSSPFPTATIQIQNVTPTFPAKVSSTPQPRQTSPAIVTPTTIDPAWVSRTLCSANPFSDRNPLPGRLVRFLSSVEVNPRGIAAAVDALAVIEARTGGVVTFKIVEKDPLVGITFILGDAIRADGTPGCGNVTNLPDARSGHRFLATGDGTFNSLIYVHLGGIDSAGCKYSPDRSPYPIAEHELAHALGIAGHFTNFTGDEGFSPETAAVLRLLYSLPAGTNATGMCQ